MNRFKIFGDNHCVILNEVKNLYAFVLCFQILRFAQDDTLILL